MRHRVIGFAHRGAPSVNAEGNTLAAFGRALALGATALETDIGLTADGVPVLAHVALSVRRRVPIAKLRRAELPPGIPALDDLYDACGTDFDLALDMAAPKAAKAVVERARARGATDRLWLTYWHINTLAEWRERWTDVHLVFPTLPLIRGGLDRTAEHLEDAGVDALNLHYLTCGRRARDSTSRHGLLLFAWGVRSSRPLSRLVQLPVDGLFCDDTPAMVAALVQT